MARHARISDDGLAQAMSRDYYKHLEDSVESVRLFDGVKSALIKLHEEGIRIGIVSNNRQIVVERIMEANGAGGFFSFVIGEDTADEPKPAPGGLLQACRLVGVAPEACLMVGDSMSDSLAARAAKMKSVGVSWNHHDTNPVESMGFSMTIDRPEQLVELIQGH
jgi:phosphoglycolate phosphatase